MISSYKIKRRDDLIPPAIHLQFRISGTWNGLQYTQIIHDIAGAITGTVYEGIGQTGALYTAASLFGANPASGDIANWAKSDGSLWGAAPAYVGGAANSATMQALEALGDTFYAPTMTIDMEGGNSTTQYCTFDTIAADLSDPSGGGTALAFWKTVFPELAELTSPELASGAPAVVVKDINGTDITANVGAGQTYPYLLTRGPIAPWVLNGNKVGGTAAQSIKATVTVTFAATGETTKNASTAVPVNIPGQHDKHATIVLVSLQGGTYARQIVTPGEVIPYGLAGYIYNIEKIPQYEGTLEIQETEITDQCAIGNNLNLSGGLTEWKTMSACVQQVSYDLALGKTTLSFGPAAHLGGKDMVERLRANRGPRWYNLNGGNLANDPGQTSGVQEPTDYSANAPSTSTKANTLQTLHTSLSDSAGNLSAYTTGFPGITDDARTSGQPGYCGLSAPNAPVRVLAKGSGGALSSFNYDDANGKKVLSQTVTGVTTTVTLNTDGSLVIANGTNTIQLELADLPGGFTGTIKLREMGFCSAAGASVYCQVLRSASYSSPYGNTT